jgi:hypothetical protein
MYKEWLAAQEKALEGQGPGGRGAAGPEGGEASEVRDALQGYLRGLMLISMESPLAQQGFAEVIGD